MGVTCSQYGLVMTSILVLKIDNTLNKVTKAGAKIGELSGCRKTFRINRIIAAFLAFWGTEDKYESRYL